MIRLAKAGLATGALLFVAQMASSHPAQILPAPVRDQFDARVFLVMDRARFVEAARAGRDIKAVDLVPANNHFKHVVLYSGCRTDTTGECHVTTTTTVYDSSGRVKLATVRPYKVSAKTRTLGQWTLSDAESGIGAGMSVPPRTEEYLVLTVVTDENAPTQYPSKIYCWQVVRLIGKI